MGSISPAGRGKTFPLSLVFLLVPLGLAVLPGPGLATPLAPPPSFFEEHREYLLGAGGIILALGGIILLLLGNISARRRAEEELREKSTLLQAIIDALPAPVYYKDDRGIYLGCNSAFERFLGKDRAEIVGRSVYGVAPKELADVYHRADRELFERGGTQVYEAVVRSADGAPRDVMFHKAVFAGPRGTAGGIVGAMLDVTERLQRERELEALTQRLSALQCIDRAIIASHDLAFTLDTLLEQVLQQLRADAACVLLFHPRTQLLEFAAGRGFRTPHIRETRLEYGEGIAGGIVRDRRLVSLSDLRGGHFVRDALVREEGFVAYHGVPLVARGECLGVLELYRRSPHHPEEGWLEFLGALGMQAAIAVDNALLFEGLQRSNAELTQAYDRTIEGWSRVLDLRDRETEGHSRRVMEMAVRLALEMGVPEGDLVHLRRGALLHDIGKMGIPDAILLKPGPLTEEEWAVMKTHPRLAHDFLSPIDHLRPALDIPYCHHERWDGSGYPRRLRGEQIPLAARIFAVVDVWDALSSNRPYRPAWGKDEVVSLLRREAGRHFDPRAVDTFLALNA